MIRSSLNKLSGIQPTHLAAARKFGTEGVRLNGTSEASSTAFRQYFREKAEGVLRACGRQCNYVMGQRIKRTCQLTELYMQLYGPDTFRQLMRGLRRRLWTQTKSRIRNRNALLDTMFATTLFTFEKSRVEVEEIENSMIEARSLLESVYLSVAKAASETNPASPGGGSGRVPTSSQPPKESAWPLDDPWPQLGRETREEFLTRVETDGRLEKVVDSQHIQMWRNPVPGSGLYEYQVFGSYEDISAKAFYYVQVDLELRKAWDSKVVKLEVIDGDQMEGGNEVVHWIHKYPYPMYSREYVYVRRCEVDPCGKTLMLMGRSVEHPGCPRTSRYVRVNDYASKMVIKPHTTLDKPGFDYVMSYFDNPQSALPSSAYNWLSNYGVPAFVQTVHDKAAELERTGKDLSKADKYYRRKDSSAQEKEQTAAEAS